MRGWPVKLGPISKRGAVKFARPNPLFVEIAELRNLHVQLSGRALSLSFGNPAAISGIELGAEAKP